MTALARWSPVLMRVAFSLSCLCTRKLMHLELCWNTRPPKQSTKVGDPRGVFALEF